jgi:protein subunit release factor B
MKRNRQLLFRLTEKDFTFQAKRGSGNGGQKKNKTSSAIQCFHEPSGAMGESEDSRKQPQNRKIAFQRCVESLAFKAWLNMKIDAAKGDIEITEPDDQGKMTTRKLSHEEV